MNFKETGLEMGKIGHWGSHPGMGDEGLVCKMKFHVENSLKSLNIMRTRRKPSSVLSYFL